MTIFVCRSIISQTFPTIRGKHYVFFIAIHTCKCVILILGQNTVGSIASIYIYSLINFLFVKYTIQNDTGELLVIVLHQVDRLVRDRSDITQYS